MSILRDTDYPNFDVFVIDNGSALLETSAWLEEMSRCDGRFKSVRLDVPFNWSLLNNYAARCVEGELYVFLNNDTEVISRDWLGRLVENAVRPEIGVCGPMLLYADGTIQHAGVVVGMGGWADHVFKGQEPLHEQRLFVSPVLRRDVLAVTGACMAIAADKFQQLGGFDERFVVCGSDVDLCLKAHRAGYRNVFIPEARLHHYESKSRNPDAIPQEDFLRSAESYGEFRNAGDPFYNRNLDYQRPNPALRVLT